MCTFNSKFYKIPSFHVALFPPVRQTTEHAERAEAMSAKQVESSRAMEELKVESARALEAMKVELSGEIGGQKVNLARAEEAIRVRCADWAGVERLAEAAIKVPAYSTLGRDDLFSRLQSSSDIVSCDYLGTRAKQSQYPIKTLISSHNAIRPQ